MRCSGVNKIHRLRRFRRWKEFDLRKLRESEVQFFCVCFLPSRLSWRLRGFVAPPASFTHPPGGGRCPTYLPRLRVTFPPRRWAMPTLLVFEISAISAKAPRIANRNRKSTIRSCGFFTSTLTRFGRIIWGVMATTGRLRRILIVSLARGCASTIIMFPMRLACLRGRRCGPGGLGFITG
jgi:hypothetical protein